MTSRGIPLLWQGQEFGENYYVPTSGWGRVMLFRPVRWDYFYDPIGKSVIWLVRCLLQIRRQTQFRQGAHYFYNDYGRYQSKGVLLFSRSADQSFSLVALNFTDEAQSVPFAFPFAGDYREELHLQHNLTGLAAEEEQWLTIPSNYGCIWTSHPAG
jgi:maltooligosyltrehalose trehalohydrolase